MEGLAVATKRDSLIVPDQPPGDERHDATEQERIGPRIVQIPAGRGQAKPNGGEQEEVFAVPWIEGKPDGADIQKKARHQATQADKCRDCTSFHELDVRGKVKSNSGKLQKHDDADDIARPSGENNVQVRNISFGR